ncbi:MAG TPA: hypothetical protein VGB52_00230 [Actinomycetota bacterium]
MVLDVKTSEGLSQSGDRKGRWKTAVGVVGGLLIATLLSLSLAWVSTYQPLVYAHQFGAYNAKVVDTYALGSEYRYAFKPGGTFELFVQIKNTGPLGVTISEVVHENHYYWRLSDVEVGTGPGLDFGGAPSAYERFAPLRLEPGDYAFFRLRYEFADCRTQGGTASIFRSFSVRFSAAWTQHKVEIRMPSPIVILDAAGDCGDAAFTDIH